VRIVVHDCSRQYSDTFFSFILQTIIIAQTMSTGGKGEGDGFIDFTSATVVVDSSDMTVSSPTLWSIFSPSLHLLLMATSTMWFVVWLWPQS